MIIKINKETIDGVVQDIPVAHRRWSVVLAIFNEAGEISFVSKSDPYSRSALDDNTQDRVEVVDDYIPENWMEEQWRSPNSQSGPSVMSFKEYHEAGFIEHYLDSWDQIEHERATKLVDEWYQKIIDEYAIRTHGGTKEARKLATKIANELMNNVENNPLLKTYRERQFELSSLKKIIQFHGPLTLEELQIIAEPELSSLFSYPPLKDLL